MSAARSLAPEWDKLWSAFIEARCAQDIKRESELVVEMRDWHRRNGQPMPEWLEVRHG